MPKTTATITIDWDVSEGLAPPAAVVKRVFTEALRDYAESLDFAGELTSEIRNERRMEGYLEVAKASTKNPSSVEEKAKRRGRKDRGDKAKRKRRKKGRSAALKRLMRGT